MVEPRDLVLTPSARLSRALQRDWALQHLDEGIHAWEKPDIAPLSVWFRALQTEILVTRSVSELPMSSSQSRLLWQKIIEADVLVGQTGLAKLAEAAWLLIHEYELPKPDQWPEALLNEDQRAFKRWAKAYQSHCRQHQLTDFPQFLDTLPEGCASGWVSLPQSITLQGFHLAPAPRYRRIFDAMAEAGVDIRHIAPNEPAIKNKVRMHCCPSTDDEVTRAAHWAKDWIQARPNERVAIVIPNLGQTLSRVEKNLRAVLDPPAFCLEPDAPPSWHISLGHPLNQTPMVADALAILKLNTHRMSQPDAARLLRSPWLKGWPTEKASRHRLILKLNDRQPHWLDLKTLIRYAREGGCSLLAKGLTAWQRQRDKSPSSTDSEHWAEQFQQELSALGFGFGRTLNSIEYQTLQHWHRVLEDHSGLGALNVPEQQGVSRQAALTQIQAMASDVLFREQDPGTPISILGVQEAMGSAFDAAWLTGMDHETWPSQARRDPLIPGIMQTDILMSTPEGAVTLAKHQLSGLLSMAPHIEASHPIGDETLTLKPTRLLQQWIEWENVSHTEPLQPMPFSPVALEKVCDDTQGPQAEAGQTTGGIRLLNDQSACPFRAFGIHRLKAKEHREPKPGMPAKDRGTLVHDVLERFWKETHDSEGLAQLDDPALQQKVTALVEQRLAEYVAQFPRALDAQGQHLEIQNVVPKVVRWLALERHRPGFVTEHLEDKMTLSIGPLILEGKPDRIDRLETGERVVIDYKTGKTSRSDWNPSVRLKDGQLPAYALTLDPPPKAIAFARVGKDQAKFDGFASGDTQIDGIEAIENYRRAPFKAIDDWQELLDAWRQGLESLASEYQQGQAAVDPVKPIVCRYCHLKAVCRIAERQAFFDLEAGAAQAGGAHE